MRDEEIILHTYTINKKINCNEYISINIMVRLINNEPNVTFEVNTNTPTTTTFTNVNIVDIPFNDQHDNIVETDENNAFIEWLDNITTCTCNKNDYILGLELYNRYISDTGKDISFRAFSDMMAWNDLNERSLTGNVNEDDEYFPEDIIYKYRKYID